MYVMTRLLHLEFVVQHTLMLEQQIGPESRIIDKYGNYYRTLEWSEVRDLTWKEKSLFPNPQSMLIVRPGEAAFS